MGSDIWNTKTNTYYQEDFLIGTDAPSKLYSLNSNVWKLIVDNTSTYDTSLNSCNPGSIWTDGENTYCNFTDFYMCSSYVLDETTNTWINKQFKDANGNDLSCLVEFASENWTDGKNTYISTSNTSLQSRHYILKNGVLESVTWNGYTDFVGSDIWSDGTNMYISSGDKQYVLNKATDTWSPKTWVGIDAFDAANIWSDGSNIYYVGGTWGNEQYRLKIMD